MYCSGLSLTGNATTISTMMCKTNVYCVPGYTLARNTVWILIYDDTRYIKIRRPEWHSRKSKLSRPTCCKRHQQGVSPDVSGVSPTLARHASKPRIDTTQCAIPLDLRYSTQRVLTRQFYWRTVLMPVAKSSPSWTLPWVLVGGESRAHSGACRSSGALVS